jgi:hypothetical protein
MRPAETTSFFKIFRPLVERSGHCEIAIRPSFLDVENTVAATRGTRIQIGAFIKIPGLLGAQPGMRTWLYSKPCPGRKAPAVVYLDHSVSVVLP